MKKIILPWRRKEPVDSRQIASPQFQKVLDLVVEGVQILDFNWRYLYVNEALSNYQNTTKEKLLGMSLLERFPGIEHSEAFKVLRLCMTGRQRQKTETQFEYHDKSMRWFELNIEPIEEGIMISSTDITVRREAEVKMNKANHLYSFISHVNQHIVRVKEEDALFRNSCRIAIEFGKFKIAWIGMFDIENKSINLVEQSGFTEDDLPFFVNASYQPDGPQDHVLRTETYYLCNDVEKELEFAHWQRFAAVHSIRSCVVLPIRKSGGIIGTFNLYSTELNFSGSEEIALLVEVADNISFALDNLENAKRQKEAETQITKNERQFRHTLENMIEGVQIHDFDWRYLYVNDALLEYSAYPREELLGFSIMEKYPGIEATSMFKVMARCMEERVPEQLETDFVFPDGSKKFFEIKIHPIPEGIFVVSIDKSDHKKTNEKLLKVNRLYAFLSAINQSIVHEIEESSLLGSACRIAAHIGQFRMAWIGLLDERGKLDIAHIKGDGSSIEQIKKYSGLDFSSPLLCNTPTGKVLSTWQYALSNDVQNDPEMAAWKEEYTLHGIKATISLPIIKFGRLIGVFGLSSATEHFFDEEEVDLLREAAGDISFAIENFENAQKHKETEELVEKNEKRFRALIEKSADMQTLSTREGKIFYGSPSITRRLGYPMDTFLETPPVGLIHEDDFPEFLEKRSSILETQGASFYLQLRVRHQDGSWVWCEATLTNLLHEPGINAMVTNFRDISEKKIAELQREFENNNLNALINNTRDLMWSVDRDFNLITSNQPFDEMVEFMSGAALGKGSSVLLAGFPPEQLDRHRKYLERAFKGETFTEIEYTPSPAEFWSEISFYPIRKGEEIMGTACHSHDITERKKSEETQQKFIKEISDYKYALDESSIVAITDQKGTIKHVNENFCRISKYNFNELLGRDHRVVNSGHHSKEFIRNLWTTISSGKTWRGEIKNKAKDGSNYWVDTTIVPFLNEYHKPYQYIAIRADITQRKSMESDLVQSEKRLKEAQAIAHLGNWQINFVTKEVLWSEEHCRIYGISAKETPQNVSEWMSFIHPEDIDYVTSSLKEAQQTHNDTALSLRIVLGNGTIKHVYVKAKFEIDQEGKVAGLHGITLDRTEIAEKEYDLRKSEAFNRGVLRSLNSQFAIIDSSGTIVAVNEEWKKFALENGETTLDRIGEGQNYFNVCDSSAKAGDETALEVLEGMKEVLYGKRMLFYFEYPCHGPDKQRWFAMRVMKFDSDEPMIVVAHQDITERKIVEEELIHKNEELQKTNTELDRFVYSASHDLRSPLTSIMGLVYLIEQGCKEADTLLCANMIRNSINRLDGFIKDILAYSRNNRAEIEASKIPLKKIIEEIVDSLRNMKEADGIRFDVHMHEHDYLYSDLSRFTIIVSNLISNAIKFHDKNKTDKFIKVTSTLDEDTLHLIIEDNGIGIEKEHQDKIFDMFFRLPNRAAGSGIGLYIVREAVKKLEGTIDVDSEEGIGTVFTVKIRNITS